LTDKETNHEDAKSAFAKRSEGKEEGKKERRKEGKKKNLFTRQLVLDKLLVRD